MPKLKTWYKVQECDQTNSDDAIVHNVLLAPKLAFPKLESLRIDDMEFVISMSREFRGFSSLEHVQITNVEILRSYLMTFQTYPI